MKRYINASEKTSQDIVDNAAELAVKLFADKGFEMDIVRADPDYYSFTVGLRVIAVDGDSSIVYRGAPCFDNWALSADIWWFPSHGYHLDRETEELVIDEAAVEKSVDYYINKWLQEYEDLQLVVAEYAEIEPGLASWAQDFVDKYADKFPGLTLSANIAATPSSTSPNITVLHWSLDVKDHPRIIITGEANGKTIKEQATPEELNDGTAESEIVNKLNRIYKRAGNGELLAILKEHGIDTTKSQYQLVAERYERFGRGGTYNKKFTCAGDYLAYFAMCIHTTPNYNNLMDDMFSDIYEFEDFVKEYPDVASMEKHAAGYWWGDGDDYIVSLKNLSTGQLLYSGDQDYLESEEDDWED